MQLDGVRRGHEGPPAGIFRLCGSAKGGFGGMLKDFQLGKRLPLWRGRGQSVIILWQLRAIFPNESLDCMVLSSYLAQTEFGAPLFWRLRCNGCRARSPEETKELAMSRVCELTGKGPMSGNNVSHANNKSRRRFLPNLNDVTLMSDALVNRSSSVFRQLACGRSTTVAASTPISRKRKTPSFR